MVYRYYRCIYVYSEEQGANGPAYFIDAGVEFASRIYHDDGTVTVVSNLTAEQHQTAIGTLGVEFVGIADE